MIRIPKKNRDLRRYVLKKDIRRIAFYILWMGLWYLGAFLYNYNHQKYPPERQMLGFKLFLWMLASAVIGFFLFRIWSLFTDRSYCAVIIRSGLSQTYEGSKDPGLHNAADYDFRLNTALQLEKEGSGKKKNLHFEQKLGFYFYYYEETRIVKLHGLPYPIAIDHIHPDAKPRVCVACGLMATEHTDRCAACFHSLIDPGELSIE